MPFYFSRFLLYPTLNVGAAPQLTKIGLLGNVYEQHGAERTDRPVDAQLTMRVELIGHFNTCITELYLHI